jgi:hypothetical protein
MLIYNALMDELTHSRTVYYNGKIGRTLTTKLVVVKESGGSLR